MPHPPAVRQARKPDPRKTAGLGNPCRARPHLGRWHPAVDHCEALIHEVTGRRHPWRDRLRGQPDRRTSSLEADRASRPLHVSVCLRAEHPCSRADDAFKPGDPSTPSDKRTSCAVWPHPCGTAPWNRSRLERSCQNYDCGLGTIMPGEPRKRPSGNPIAKRNLRRATVVRVENRRALNSVMVKQTISTSETVHNCFDDLSRCAAVCQARFRF